MESLKFNIHDLNFILTFAGFAIFTTFFESISSITYRILALGVALLSFLLSEKNILSIPKSLILLLTLMVLLDLKTAYILLTDVKIYYIGSRNLALLFMFCITLLPTIAFAFSYKKIHWRTMLVIIEILLFFTISLGLLNTSSSDLIREKLNERQSTLAFGDNSSYLLILSTCLLTQDWFLEKRIFRIIWRSFLVIAVIISILGIARAGSRGPAIAAIVGILFIIYTFPFPRQIYILIISCIFVITLGINFKTIERFAPVLYSRMMLTINERDTSGREALFSDAINIIEEDPVSGGCPITLSATQFSSSHNGFLDVGVGLGIFGLTIYACLSIWLIVQFLIHKNMHSSLEFLFIGSQFFLSTVRAMSGANLLYNPNYALSIACACLVVSYLRKGTLENNK